MANYHKSLALNDSWLLLAVRWLSCEALLLWEEARASILKRLASEY